jgi:ricin-type beta-trefoil lectin protein
MSPSSTPWVTACPPRGRRASPCRSTATAGRRGRAPAECYLGSGKCLTTDGVAGHQLYQFTCVGSPLQKWRGTVTSVFNPDAGQLTNAASGLVMDVNGASATAGAAITTWYANGGRNQYFSYYQLG